MQVAQKITNNIFTYQLTGFGQYLTYDASNRSLMLNDAETGAPLKIKEKDKDMDFDTFILVGRNVHLKMVEAQG